MVKISLCWLGQSAEVWRTDNDRFRNSELCAGDIGWLVKSKSTCQSAFKFDPRSASNFDPLDRRVRAVAVAPSELVGVAETARARVVG